MEPFNGVRIKQVVHTLLLVLLGSTVYGQKVADLCGLNGIWIATDYVKSFDSSKSAIDSRGAFDPRLPAGLRINCSEFIDGKWNLGYAFLHDHSIHPEVSGDGPYAERGRGEQGHFLIDVTDSILMQSMITFNDGYVEQTDYRLSWKYGRDTTLQLIAYQHSYDSEFTNHFTRIAQVPEKGQRFPNPLYFYTRDRILSGRYWLKHHINGDSTFVRFDNYGDVEGYAPLEGFKTYYSTDVYCGPELMDDILSFCKMNWDDEGNSEYLNYVIRHSADLSNTLLYAFTWNKTESRTEQPMILGELVMELEWISE